MPVSCLQLPETAKEGKCPASPATTVLDDSDSDGCVPSLEDDGLYKLLIQSSSVEGSCHSSDVAPHTRRVFKRELEAPPPEPPEVDIEEMLEKYPMIDTSSDPCPFEDSPRLRRRVVPSYAIKSSALPLGSQVEVAAAKPTKPLPIVPMSLAAKRVAALQMVHDMPCDIQNEAQNRLNYVINSPSILLMYNKSSWDFTEHAVSLKREFYIGITERPRERFEDHYPRFSQMAVWIYEDSRYSAAAERSLIRSFRDCSWMLNVGNGGERRSGARPHFLYVALRSTSCIRSR
jgi:hypothetical protein